MNKKIINGILAICALGLCYACYMSIYSDIAFDNEEKAREKVVIARLTQIRDAEEQYKQTFGYYCGTIDSLIDFVKNGRCVDKVIKDGVLTDDQLEAGMTEQQAVRQGLIRRDTVWVTTAEKLGISNPDSLKFIPVGYQADGTTLEFQNYDKSKTIQVPRGEIELRKANQFNLKSNEYEELVEFRARLDDFLDGMDAKRIKNLKSKLKTLDRNRAELMFDNEDDMEGEWYGLRMGDLKDTGNKMAGNWE